MFWDNHEGFGENWDLGGMVIGDLISFPIKAYIREQCRKEGIDIHNWRRQGASLTAPAVGAFIASFAGGPLGFLVGLMGYAAAMSASYPGDRDPKKDFEMALAIQAGEIATKALKSHVSKDTWNEMCDEVQEFVRRYSSSNISIQEAISLTYEAIARVNSNAAEQWVRVYRTAVRESG